MHKNGDVALLLVLRRVVRRKFIRRRGQKFLEIATSNFPPILDLSERLFIADPISQAIGFGSDPTPPSLRSLIIQYFGILLSGLGWCELMDQANRPKVV